jgi:outer membrane protein assembly factor BamB
MKINRSAPIILVLLSTTLLGGCSWLGLEKEKKQPLPGERISVLEMQKALEPSNSQMASTFSVGPAQPNADWLQPGGTANHNLQHLALSDSPLKEIWSESIGDGSDDDLPLTAQPVVSQGIIYTMDTDSNVTAFRLKDGDEVWSNTVRPKGEDETVIGGGLSISDDTLYATNGYDELLAMSAEKGGIFWRVKLSAPSRAAPTILGGNVYVLTLDNHLTAYERLTGKLLWKYEGFAESAGLVSAASPAAENEIVVCPLSSGELTALRIENGAVAWTDSLSPSLQTGGAASLPDIAGLPVIDNGAVVAISYGGKIVAIDTATGQRIWAKDIGGAKTPWVAGNMIFLITSNAELVALSRQTGDIEWVKSLSAQDHSEFSYNSLLWQGPVMAGNRLIVTSAGEEMFEISPQDGTTIRKTDLGFHVAIPPVVADNTLYLVSDDGTLYAWK